jgi:hypothetical protein
MIIHGCIKIHPKDCGGWIIVTGFRVLLISQHLFPEILLEAVLGISQKVAKIFTGNASPTLIPTETVRRHLSAVQNYRQNHRRMVRIPKDGQ